jgi:rod shape-determining protein MreC
MSGFLKRYRDVVAVGTCLLVPAVVLYAQSRSSAEAGPAVRLLIQVTAPLQDGMAYVVSTTSDWLTRHAQDAQSLEDARTLRMEVAYLRRANERLEEVERENQRLRDLLRAAPTPGPASMTAARVVAVGASPVWRTLRIDAGRSAGVARGMAVVGARGAVGSVMRTTHGYSDVLLITDRQSAVDVMVPRSGARGLLRGPGGEGSALLRVEGLERATAVNVGDEVVCSGLGAAFPRGTRVGLVEQVEMPEGSLTATALVRPAVEFDRLANVLVILAPEQGAQPMGPLPAAGASALPPPSAPMPSVEPAGQPALPTPAPGPVPAPAPTPAPKAGPAPEQSVLPPDTPVPQEQASVPGGGDGGPAVAP